MSKRNWICLSDLHMNRTISSIRISLMSSKIYLFNRNKKNSFVRHQYAVCFSQFLLLLLTGRKSANEVRIKRFRSIHHMHSLTLTRKYIQLHKHNAESVISPTQKKATGYELNCYVCDVYFQFSGQKNFIHRIWLKCVHVCDSMCEASNQVCLKFRWWCSVLSALSIPKRYKKFTIFFLCLLY